MGIITTVSRWSDGKTEQKRTLQKGETRQVSITTTHFQDRVMDVQSAPLMSVDIALLQVNLGYRCNMACKHCHVEAGPGRNEMMSGDTVDAVIEILKNNPIHTIDITGGAPELNPHFSYLIERARQAGCHVIVRTNLTILLEEDMTHLPDFFSHHSVEVVASLPYYTDDVDKVRGKGTFERCIKALKKLNALGYGNGATQKRLNLVYNPAGPFLSPAQNTLEEDFKKELHRRFGISFDRLYAFTNMPIGRFREFLLRANGFERYMDKLVHVFNPATLNGLMCRHLISVGWDGRLYDCDFNQMLGFTVHDTCPQHIKEFDYTLLSGRTITAGNHCYACTAGQGST
ncbi:MAG TPA: arsenosugar biosynthesis radical SAM (seleno)protein ArsS [Thermodesulfovibrionales bacterium]|nr:arsenosugar biosynthesis radical SAM (seleno)protein ArsS [Thermodesulfovibrionales bacterium]